MDSTVQSSTQENIMIGTEKQVAWAQSIKADAIAQWEALAEKLQASRRYADPEIGVTVEEAVDGINQVITAINAEQRASMVIANKNGFAIQDSIPSQWCWNGFSALHITRSLAFMPVRQTVGTSGLGVDPMISRKIARLIGSIWENERTNTVMQEDQPQEAGFFAANLEEEGSGDMAPVIYRVTADGQLGDVYRTWQRSDGTSQSRDLARDRLECAAVMRELESEAGMPGLMSGNRV